MQNKPIPDTGDNAVTWALYRAALPLAWLCHRLGVSANLVSGVSLLTAGLGAVSLAWFRSPFGFVFLWIISIVLDFADGMVARFSGRVNQTALRLDHTLDLLKIAISFVALASYWNRSEFWALAMLTLASVLIFTVLNHDLGHASGSITSSTTGRRPRVGRFWRSLVVMLSTLHAGSLLLIAFAALRLTIAYVVFAYLLVLCAALSLRIAVRLYRLPRPS